MIPLFRKYSMEKLKLLPRYQRGICKFDAYSVEYVDPISLYYEYRDIFKKRIYHFQCKDKSPFVIDAGGYIGMSALYFKSIYPNANITVFEPDPNIFSVLSKNVEMNNLKGIFLVNAGLGKKNTFVDFYPDGADGGSMYKISDNKTAKIKIVKLSSYINQPVDLLKMNIEGAEGEVLEEVENKLHFVKEIILEYHAFDNLPQHLGKILTILDRNSFRYLITNAVGKGIDIPFHLPKKYQYFNLIYAKQV